LKLHHHLEQHGKQGYFSLEPLADGIHVGLRASNGNYVAVDNKGHVYLAEHLRGDETSFKIEHSGVRIYIRSALDRYLGVNALGHIHTQHHKGHHEEFEQILSQE